MEQRLFQKFFAVQLIPQLFYADPGQFAQHLNSQSLRQLWLDGCRELKEKIAPDGLALKAGSEGLFIHLPRPRYPGEAFALLLRLEPPGVFALEKTATEGYALTSVTREQEHQYLETLNSPDLERFQERVRKLS